MDDKTILDLYFSRSEAAIKHTDDTYGRRLFHLANNIVRNDQDAEESVRKQLQKDMATHSLGIETRSQVSR